MAKKLMALLAAVALAGAAQAMWFASGSNIYSAGTTSLYSGEVNLYLGTSTSFDSLAQSWFTNKTTPYSLATTMMYSGSLSLYGNDNVDYGQGVLLAIFDSTSGNMFVASTTVGMGDPNIDFGDLGTSSSAAATAWKDGTTSAGWYSAPTAVPEPTSGLLLLVGGALLALRRRRA